MASMTNGVTIKWLKPCRFFSTALKVAAMECSGRWLVLRSATLARPPIPSPDIQAKSYICGIELHAPILVQTGAVFLAHLVVVDFLQETQVVERRSPAFQQLVAVQLKLLDHMLVVVFVDIHRS